MHNIPTVKNADAILLELDRQAARGATINFVEISMGMAAAASFNASRYTPDPPDLGLHENRTPLPEFIEGAIARAKV